MGHSSAIRRDHLDVDGPRDEIIKKMVLIRETRSNTTPISCMCKSEITIIKSINKIKPIIIIQSNTITKTKGGLQGLEKGTGEFKSR